MESQYRENFVNARDLINIFLDKESFEEIGAKRYNALAGESDNDGAGVITGFGSLKGRGCAIFAQESSVKGGTVGRSHGQKIAYLIQWAIKSKQPLIGVFNSAGARIQEGIVSLEATADVVRESVNASGYIPSIAIVVGPCAGGSAYLPVLFDFVIMLENQGMLFLTGPKIVERVLQQKLSKEDLGGSSMHEYKSGLAQFSAKTLAEAFELTSKILNFFPDYYLGERQRTTPAPPKQVEWNELFLKSGEPIHDVKKIIHAIFDDHDPIIYSKKYASNMFCAWTYLDGKPTGIVANQALIMGGCMDVNATNKSLRFIQICDAYNIPLLFILNSTGFLPGKKEEENRILGAGAKFFNVVVTSNVPKITLIIGKGTGGSYGGMNSRGLGADLIYAWPSASFRVMGEVAAATILETNSSDNIFTPYWAANQGIIDDVIFPENTRAKLISGYNMLAQKVTSKLDKKRTILPMN